MITSTVPETQRFLELWFFLWSWLHQFQLQDDEDDGHDGADNCDGVDAAKMAMAIKMTMAMSRI